MSTKNTPSNRRREAARFSAMRKQRDTLLAALVALVDNYRPITGNPSLDELIEHWEYEKTQGRGDADIHIAALRAIQQSTTAP